jgi:uncharacterized repeat protein (TIGR04076 family)
MTEEEYREKWKETGPLEITMITLQGKCMHQLGDTFRYKTPYERPQGVCFALLHILDLYTWRAACGFPSWEKDNEHIYRIHCPSKLGTVWEMKKIKEE